MAAQETKSGYLPELDGLRAIAILLVISAHMHSHFWHALTTHQEYVLFFVMSGYLITAIALREEQKTGHLHLRAFFLRRCFRLLPLYYLVLAAYCVVILGLGFTPEKSQPLRSELPYMLSYLQELPYFRAAGHSLSPFYQTWSLGIEEKFYLVWPIICFFLCYSRPALRLPVTLVLLVLTATLGPLIAPYSLILVGCALALLLQHPAPRRALLSLGTTFATVSFLLLITLTFTGHSPLLYAFSTAAALCALVLHHTWWNVALAVRPLALLGRLSYAIYLIHLICLDIAEHYTHRTVPSYLLAVALAIAAAAVLHLAVEQPFVRLGRRLAKRYVRRIILANPTRLPEISLSDAPSSLP